MQGIPTTGDDGTKREYGQHLVDAGCSHWRPAGENDILIPGNDFIHVYCLQDIQTLKFSVNWQMICDRCINFNFVEVYLPQIR